jgi:hypothetical protein
MSALVRFSGAACEDEKTAAKLASWHKLGWPVSEGDSNFFVQQFWSFCTEVHPRLGHHFLAHVYRFRCLFVQFGAALARLANA